MTQLETLSRRRRLVQMLAETAGQPDTVEIRAIARSLKVNPSTIYLDLRAIRDDTAKKVAQRDSIFWIQLGNAQFETSVREIHRMLKKLDEKNNGLDLDEILRRKESLIRTLSLVTREHTRFLQRTGAIPEEPIALDVRHQDSLAVQLIVRTVLEEDPDRAQAHLEAMKQAALAAVTAEEKA